MSGFKSWNNGNSSKSTSNQSSNNSRGSGKQQVGRNIYNIIYRKKRIEPT